MVIAFCIHYEMHVYGRLQMASHPKHLMVMGDGGPSPGPLNPTICFPGRSRNVLSVMFTPNHLNQPSVLTGPRSQIPPIPATSYTQQVSACPATRVRHQSLRAI